ncbi:MAG: hypothetical protein FLDDKLPJ_00327 [Phycisphaerae bacterium]|nr:hypothetical protein [Phycisphaerae bacterium]
MDVTKENPVVHARASSAFALRGDLRTFALLLIVGGYVTSCVLGIRWGLPSRAQDAALFGDGPVWRGEDIYRLSGRGWGAADRGADVDVDPIARRTREPILLNESAADIARIYLRYRLYSHQPDEMIVFRALGGMKPSAGDFDPKLYQYGGLFLYPVGGLLKWCGRMNLIDVGGDIASYLDRPDEFGKFYIVSRAYSAGWGLVGLLAALAIGRRLSGTGAGLLAAAIFALMPVVVCMSHEGKPHLPGAALMLVSVALALRSLSGGAIEAPVEPEAIAVARRRKRRAWWGMCVVCGASVGMVLSSAPIVVLIPLTAWLMRREETGATGERGASSDAARASARSGASAVKWMLRVAAGAACAGGTYLATNPYVAINVVRNREVLRSNFGNSLDMYEVSRVFEGLVRVGELTAEGATTGVALAGLAGWAWLLRRRGASGAVLVVPAVVFLLQFVLIGAGKPAEYGRFGVFADAALAIGAACVLSELLRRGGWRRGVGAAMTAAIVLLTARGGYAYLRNFVADEGPKGSRAQAARHVADESSLAGRGYLDVGVGREPAPYCCPPLNFSAHRLRLFASQDAWRAEASKTTKVWIETSDAGAPPGSVEGVFGFGSGETPISWANKPMTVIVAPGEFP